MTIEKINDSQLIIKENTTAFALLVLIIAFMCSWVLLLFITNNFTPNEQSTKEVSLSLIAFLLVFTFIYFYNAYTSRTVVFDKNTKTLTITSSNVFMNSDKQYPLSDILQILSRPITIYNGAYGLQGIMWNKLYGDQIPTEGVFNEIVIILKENKEYILKQNAYTLFLTNPNKINDEDKVTAEKIANFLNVPLSKEEIQKPLVQF